MREDNIIYEFYKVIKVCIENLTLPTGKNLLPSLGISSVICVVSLISNLLNIFTFIDYRGALLGCIVLAGLCFIERSEYSELSKLYRDAKLRVGHAKEWAKNPSFRKQTSGSSDDNIVNVEDARSECDD